MNIEDVLVLLKADREYTEMQVRHSIGMLRGILDRVETDLDEGRVQALNGLQGNEWRLYSMLSKLEMEERFIKQLEEMESKSVE